MLGERRGQPSRERHVAQPSTLRRLDLAVPVRPRDTQLPLREIDVAPLERDHLAAPQPGLTAQQHDQVASADRSPARPRRAVRTRRSRGTPLRPSSTGSSLTVHGIRSITSHSTAFFSSTLSTARMLFTVFGDFDLELRLQPLHVLALDRVEPLVDRTPASGARGGSSSFAAIPLGFCRFARAWPSMNRGANSCRVGTSFGRLSGRCRAAAGAVRGPHPIARRPTRDDIGARLRSRMPRAVRAATRMSTSQPPSRYGRIVTLIAVTTFPAMARASGPASLANRLRAGALAGRCGSRRAAAAARSSRRSPSRLVRSSSATSVGVNSMGFGFKPDVLIDWSTCCRPEVWRYGLPPCSTFRRPPCR